MLDAFQVSERWACQVAKVCRSQFRYQSQADDQAFLRKSIREIVATRMRYVLLARTLFTIFQSESVAQ